MVHPVTWVGERHEGVDFVVGRVHHVRDHPVRRSFSYPLRLAVIDLDAPPPWFARSGQAADHLTADQARARSGADGPVKLLTSPWTFGYVQNPISVYYMYDTKKKSCSEDGIASLRACAAEVTNTPWGERVVFDFDPKGQRVPKSLHVSPFMDALGDWFISTTDPLEIGIRGSSKMRAGEDSSKSFPKKLAVRVNVVGHPSFGDYFRASFVGRIESDSIRRARNERAGLRTLWKHACTPHRVAFWIYYQAFRILWAGVSFFPPPGFATIAERAKKRDGELEALRKDGVSDEEKKKNFGAYIEGGCPLRLTRREAGSWPWKT